MAAIILLALAALGPASCRKAMADRPDAGRTEGCAAMNDPAKKSDSEWRKSLSQEEYQVLRCSATEEAAASAEREAVRVKGLRLLEGRLGDRASGIVTGLVPQGLFVELDDLPVEGFVRVSLWLEDQFTLDRTGVRMVGRRTRRRFSLGDAVQVTVARVDVPARECDLALEQPQRRATARGRRRRGRRD